MRCAITGAAGHVGSAMARCFGGHGWEVLALGRRPGPEGSRHVPYELGGDPGCLPWQGVDALVHCAYDFRPTKWDAIYAVNVAGSVALLRAAREKGVRRIVFISSLSSFAGCQSLYGKAKLEIEAAAFEVGCEVVRPGLVWATKPGAMLGALESVVTRRRFVPLIGDGSYPQYLVFDDDLAQLVFALCQADAIPVRRPISAAHPGKRSLRSLLESLAKKHGREPRFVPVPWRLIYFGLRMLETLGLPAPFRSDSLLGIVFQNPAPDFNLPEMPEINFRPFA
jgi:nucleoside-diphosphate-sugar epimerase